MTEPKMIALIPQGPGSIVPRQMRDMEDARAHQTQGFDVRILNDDGTTSPLPEPDAPASAAANEGASDEEKGQGQEGVLKVSKRKKKGE